MSLRRPGRLRGIKQSATVRWMEIDSLLDFSATFLKLLARLRCSVDESRPSTPPCTEVRHSSITRRNLSSTRDDPGILARNIPSDIADLDAQQISPITIVVCNLYPFNETIAKVPAPSIAEAVEEVDIGGVTLLRAAAKNHERVVILSDPKDYDEFLTLWKAGNGSVPEDFKRRMAVKVLSSPRRSVQFSSRCETGLLAHCCVRLCHLQLLPTSIRFRRWSRRCSRS